MNFLKKLLFVAALGFFAFGAHAQNGYEPLAAPQETANPDKIEVIEFFWYGCPHCFQFEPHIGEWHKKIPDSVDFVRMAPPLNPQWKVHSQAFYAAEALGVLDKFHEPMFNAIHKDKKPMIKPKEIAKLAESLDIDPKKFTDTMKSFAVDAKIRQSIQKAKDMAISSVPIVIINGKYKTSATLAGSYPELITVLNTLVASEGSK